MLSAFGMGNANEAEVIRPAGITLFIPKRADIRASVGMGLDLRWPAGVSIASK